MYNNCFCFYRNYRLEKAISSGLDIMRTGLQNSMGVAARVDFTSIRMKTALIAFLFTLVLHSKADVAPKRYVVDLDQPPEERWKIVTEDNKDVLFALRDFMLENSPNYEELTILASTLFQYFPEDYAGEIRGISRYSGLTVGEVALWNMLYDISAYDSSKGFPACTSIVASTKNGTIIHGRNLDYYIPMLSNMTIVVDFQKSNHLLYTSISFVGSVGVLTAQKPHKFTVSYNERDAGTWQDNDIEAIKTGMKGIVNFAIRNILEDPDADFATAVRALSSTPLIAPSYIIVGGLQGDEGVVITHNRSRGIDMWQLGSSHQDQWFLVETNYDHWDATPSNDHRRDIAISAMRNTGQDHLNSDTMYKVLSTPLVYNYNTVYSVVMSAGQPQIFRTSIRSRWLDFAHQL